MIFIIVVVKIELLDDVVDNDIFMNGWKNYNVEVLEKSKK